MPEQRRNYYIGAIALYAGVFVYLVGTWKFGPPWTGFGLAAVDTMLALLLAGLAVPLGSLATGRVGAARGFFVCLAVFWLVSGGLVEVLSPLAVLLLAAAVATFLPATPVSPLVRLIAGLGIVAAILGWLLPFPVHGQPGWVLLVTLLAAWRRRQLRDLWISLRDDTTELLRDGGAALWLLAPVLLVVLAPALMPRLGPDDLSYHLMIPRELLEFGHSRLNASTQVWIFAPWSLDLLHGLSWIFAGRETTTAGLNVFWLLAAAALCARIGRELGLGPRMAWLAAAVYASVPMVTQITGSLQVESASPAILAALYLAVGRVRERGVLLLVAALAGFLLGSKTSNALLALPLAIWMASLLYRHRLGAGTWLGAIVLGALVGGSSYFWAAILAGNPVLPLFNGMFESPYFRPENWRDNSWQLEWGITLPWKIVFETGTYLSAKTGAMGAVWLVFAGILPFAIADFRRSPALVIGLAGFFLLFSQVQFLRYVLPTLVLLVPGLLAAAGRLAPKGTGTIATGLVLLQVASIPTASWMFAGQSLRTFLTEGPGSVISNFAPERDLAAHFESVAEPGDRLLFTDRFRAYVALLPGRSSTVAWYSHGISTIFTRHGGYGSEEAWKLALQASGANYLVVSNGQAKDGLAEVMLEHEAERVATSKTSALYRLNLQRPLELGTSETGITAVASPSVAGPSVGSAQVRVTCDMPGKPLAVGWTVQSAGRPPVQHWSWTGCDYEGTTTIRVAISALAPVERVSVVVNPAPPSAGMNIGGVDGSFDLRLDPLPSQSPVVGIESSLARLVPGLHPGNWAVIEPQ